MTTFRNVHAWLAGVVLLLVGVLSLRAADSPPALTIVESRYGTAAQSRDVTALLAGKVKDGRLTLQVSSADLGGDPALFPFQQKRITIKYRLGEATQTVVVAENDTVELGMSQEDIKLLAEARDKSGAGALVVLQARWGAGDTWVDVTDTVRNRIVDSLLDLTVNTPDLGDDPAIGTPKTLVIRYVLPDESLPQTSSTPDFGRVHLGHHPAVRKLLGAWQAKLEIDDAKLTAGLKAQGVPEAKLAAALAAEREEIGSVTVTIVYNADGTGATQATTPGAAEPPEKGTWQVLLIDGKNLTLRLTDAQGKTDEPTLEFTSDDTYLATPPGADEAPIKFPVTFHRVPVATTKPATAPQAP